MNKRQLTAQWVASRELNTGTWAVLCADWRENSIDAFILENCTEDGALRIADFHNALLARLPAEAPK